jgi:hypothetical protein
VAGSAGCTNCPRGTYLATLGAASSNACIQCELGKFSNTLGAVASSACQDCGSNLFSDTTGATICKSCTAVLCQNTQYSRPCTRTRNNECGNCNSDATLPANAAFSDLQSSACPWTCNSGFFKNADSCCVDCDSGRFNPTCSTSKTACVACFN